jgi:hypothetical protein
MRLGRNHQGGELGFIPQLGHKNRQEGGKKFFKPALA